jgi:hypothetical protein
MGVLVIVAVAVVVGVLVVVGVGVTDGVSVAIGVLVTKPTGVTVGVPVAVAVGVPGSIGTPLRQREGKVACPLYVTDCGLVAEIVSDAYAFTLKVNPVTVSRVPLEARASLSGIV